MRTIFYFCVSKTLFIKISATLCHFLQFYTASNSCKMTSMRRKITIEIVLIIAQNIFRLNGLFFSLTPKIGISVLSRT